MTAGTPTPPTGNTSSRGPTSSCSIQRRLRRHGRQPQPPPPDGPADLPAARADQNSMLAHAQLLEKAKQGRIDVYFEGDSIVRRWGALDYPELLAHWRASFFG